LETIYGHFDEIAKRRRVFKVETIGDCYVAVVGLPDPRKDHAVVMTRFSRDCLDVFSDVTKKLEIELGPDTVSTLLTARSLVATLYTFYSLTNMCLILRPDLLVSRVI
jgi:class 3 adenylate cyclase